MAELKIYLTDSLNERFRRIAMSVHGYGRGSLSKAAEEALTRWCSEHEHSSVQEKSPGRDEAVETDDTGKAQSHINPDEREDADEGLKMVGRDQSMRSVGSTA